MRTVTRAVTAAITTAGQETESRNTSEEGKKQYRTTIFSLFISIVLFISASSFSSYVKSSVDMVNDISENDISMYIEEEKEGEIEEIRERVRGTQG